MTQQTFDMLADMRLSAMATELAKRYPCTGTRRLTSALSAFLLAELFTGMEVGRGGLNIPTG